MTVSDKILLGQTIGVWLAVLVAPLTVWAMFKQTQVAANLSKAARRQECVEKLLGAFAPGCLQSGPEFYRVLNAVPALFPYDKPVLEQYRHFRQLSVQRDTAQRQRGYEMLVVRMAAACGLALTEADVAASFSEQWTDRS